MAHNKVTARPDSEKPKDTKTSKSSGQSKAQSTSEYAPGITLSIAEADELTSLWWKMESLERLVGHAGSMFDGGQGVQDVGEFLGPIVKSIQPYIDTINERRTRAEAEARTAGAQ